MFWPKLACTSAKTIAASRNLTFRVLEIFRAAKHPSVIVRNRANNSTNLLYSYIDLCSTGKKEPGQGLDHSTTLATIRKSAKMEMVALQSIS